MNEQQIKNHIERAGGRVLGTINEYGETSVKAGEDRWIITEGGAGMVAQFGPDTDFDSAEGLLQRYALWPRDRVHGDRYQPYSGRTEWQRAANKSMALAANTNFIKIKRH